MLRTTLNGCLVRCRRACDRGQAEAGYRYDPFFYEQPRRACTRPREIQNLIKQNGTIWVSWYKKAAKLPTEITEDTVRDVALPLGLVDVRSVPSTKNGRV